jgi:hypothetical protein
MEFPMVIEVADFAFLWRFSQIMQAFLIPEISSNIPWFWFMFKRI